MSPMPSFPHTMSKFQFLELSNVALCYVQTVTWSEVSWGRGVYTGQGMVWLAFGGGGVVGIKSSLGLPGVEGMFGNYFFFLLLTCKELFSYTRSIFLLLGSQQGLEEYRMRCCCNFSLGTVSTLPYHSPGAETAALEFLSVCIPPLLTQH